MPGEDLLVAYVLYWTTGGSKEVTNFQHSTDNHPSFPFSEATVYATRKVELKCGLRSTISKQKVGSITTN